jgi:serine/threonine protein kinase
MQTIGRYRIEQELGRGAMGVVYRAFDPAIGRRIAIKTIRLDQLGESRASAVLRARLLREAQSAGILSHPNIVTIYDISEDETNAYIFMEYVDGSTMDHLARGIPVAQLIGILEQAADALDYAHAQGIVHRDIKPANIMLSGQLAKITDFGVARLRHRDSTQTVSLLGTPSYMSPEQISGKEITGAADQYSLAVIAYEFLSGNKPFDTLNVANLLFRITQEAPEVVPNVSAAVNQVLLKGLAKQASNRYPDCRQFVAALAASLGQEVSTLTPNRDMSGDEPTIQTSTQHPSMHAVPSPILIESPQLRRGGTPPQSRWKAIAGALIGVAVLGGLLYIGFGRSSTPAVTPPPERGVEEANANPKPSPAGEPLKPGEIDYTPQAPVETKPQVTPPPADGTTPVPSLRAHTVLFESSPEGAEILIDNGDQDRCPRTPCTLEIPDGSHRVLAKLAGFEDTARTISVPSQTQVVFTFEKPLGTLSVLSTPAGATIRIDGKDRPEKTPAMLKLAPGQYKLEVLKEGLPAQSSEIVVRNGAIQTLTFNWNP